MRAILVGALVTGALLAVTPASSEILRFRATLAPSSEAPASPRAAGLADLTLDTESKILSWRVTYIGLSGPLIGAHFEAPPEPGSAIAATIDLAPPPLTNPMVSSARLNDIEIGDLRAGLWSVNLLTAKNPHGEIHGDLERAP